MCQACRGEACFGWLLPDGSEQVADMVGDQSAPPGSDFWYLAPPGLRIVALFGRAGRYLDAIGVTLDTIR